MKCKFMFMFMDEHGSDELTRCWVLQHVGVTMTKLYQDRRKVCQPRGRWEGWGGSNVEGIMTRDVIRLLNPGVLAVMWWAMWA